MHCASGLLHNLTAPSLKGPLAVRRAPPEDGHITGLCYLHLPQGSLVNRSSTSNVRPQGSREGKGTVDWKISPLNRVGISVLLRPSFSRAASRFTNSVLMRRTHLCSACELQRKDRRWSNTCSSHLSLNSPGFLRKTDVPARYFIFLINNFMQ